MNKSLFIVLLCAQQGDCRSETVMSKCEPVGVFHNYAYAKEWQQEFCQQWHLPACEAQPFPRKVPFHDAQEFLRKNARVPKGMTDNLESF